MEFAAPSPPEMPGRLTVLYDGVPTQGCVCKQSGITCENVPRSVQTIGLRYDQGLGPNGETLTQGGLELSLYFRDNECEATHRICPL